MKIRAAFLLASFPAALAVACGNPAVVVVPDDPLMSRNPGAGPALQLQNFVSRLSGDQEVPPVATSARGVATFQLDKGGMELHFQLNVANIVDVTQAHIHCGAPGVNGPAVVFLYPEGPPPVLIEGRSDGVLSRGTATNDHVIPRPDSEECPGGVASLADVIEKMRTGQAYTNVHTVEHSGGEIRGLIHASGPHP